MADSSTIPPMTDQAVEDAKGEQPLTLDEGATWTSPLDPLDAAERRRPVDSDLHEAQPTSKWWYIGLILVIAGAVLVRLYGIDNESIWYDETYSLSYLTKPSLIECLQQVRRDEPSMPLYFILEYLWARCFGHSVTTMRLLSVLFSVLTVPLIYGIGRDLYGRRAGLIAALFVAGAPLHLRYGLEIRMYALSWLLALCSVYTLLRVASDRRPALLWWVAHGLVSLALIWTHPFNALLLVAEGVVLTIFFLRRGRTRDWFIWMFLHATVAQTIIPWILLRDNSRMSMITSWIRVPDGEFVYHAFLRYVGAAYFVVPGHCPKWILEWNYWLTKGLAVTPFLAALILAGVVVFKWRTVITPVAWSAGERLSLLLAWAVLPPLILIAISVVVRPCFVHRYTGYSSYALFLLVGAALQSISWRPGAWFASTVVAGLLAVQTCIHVCSLPYRPEWKGVAERVATLAPKRPIYVNHIHAAHCLEFYLKRDRRLIPRFRTLEELCRHLPLDDAQRRVSWVILTANANNYSDAFEQLLKRQKIRYTKKVFPGGNARLLVFFISDKNMSEKDRGASG
ncbi:MAG: glycosyltransferase family 39 protein [Candidatus Hydrogenedentes bacterium]|nr:glycosyltransferase family 39 protein [Candidatus Hydrogenedentota bacterium]